MAREIILAVDDLPQNLMTIKLGLRKFDFELHTANDGLEALEMLKTLRPDIILMDIQMPKKDGFSTAEDIQKDPNLADVPIIFLSAMRDVDSIVRCFDSGGVDYISKPFRQQELIARIETHLKIRRLKQQVDRERDKMKAILGNMLPESYIQQISNGKRPTPQYFDNVTVVFADFKNFTELSQRIGPKTSIDHLNQIFFGFDEIVSEFGLERIKTIGDGYFAVSGINTNGVDGPLRTIATMLKMQEFARFYDEEHPDTGWHLRIGAHHGPVIAGVVGFQKIAFDVWGSTVNVAARFQSVAPTKGIVISSELLALVGEYVAVDSTSSHILHHVGETNVHHIVHLTDTFPEHFLQQYNNLDVRSLFEKYDESDDIFSRIFPNLE